MRIFSKLIIVFLAFIIIPVMFVSYMTFYISKNTLEKEMLSKLTFVADQDVTEIETYLHEKINDLKMLGHMDVYDTTYSMLNRLSGDPSQPAYIAAKDKIDRQFIMFEHEQAYADIMLTNMAGKIIYVLNPAHGPELNTILPDQDDIFKKIKTGIYIGDIHQVTHQKDGVYSLSLVSPAYDAASKMIGFIIVEVDVGAMYKQLRGGYGLGKTWETQLVTKTSDHQITFINPVQDRLDSTLTEAIPIGAEVALPAQKAILGERGSGVSIDYRGKKVLAAWRPIPSTRWGIVVKIDQNEVYVPIERLGKLLIVVILMTVLSAVLAAFAMARSLASPILRLKEGVELVGGGNLNYTVGTDAQDEVGELSRAFDAMTKHLQHTTTSIYFLNEEITERKKAEAKFKTLFESSRDAIVTLEPPSWRFTSGNPATVKMFGTQDETTLTRYAPWEHSPPLQPDGRTSAEKAREMIETAMREGSHHFEWTHRRSNGEDFLADVLLTRMEYEGKVSLQATIRDITERRQAEVYREMSLDVLQTLNAPGTLHESIQRTIATLKTRSGFDAVGVRLQEGEDYPYYNQEGFSDIFLKTETPLIARDAHGGICRDKDGKPCLECACGLVISGKADPANPFVSPGGSFWTNDLSQLLDLPPDQSPLFHPRNQCAKAGYASVALVPIRHKDKNIGLIQFNDTRKGRFTLATIEALEGIASHIGENLIRKKMEQELRDSNAFTSAVVENVPLMIFLKDAKNLRFIELNRAGEELLGCDRKDLIGKSDLDCFPAVQAAFFMAKDQEVLNGEAGFLDIPEEPIDTAKKGRRLLHTWKVCIRGADGAAKYLLGISEDITERQQAEENLARLSHHNELILYSVGEGILGLDLQGNHTFVNPAATEMLGFSAEELIGHPSHSLWHHTKADGSPNPQEECKIYAVYHDGMVQASTDVFWRKDGTCFPVEYISTPIYENNKLAGAVVTFTDISERLRATSEKEKLEDQLRMSQKLEAIGLLTGGIAHDFNNLLGVITGFCELSLLDVKDGDPLQENLKEIQGAAEHAAALTHQLLAFGRHQVLELKVLCLNDVFAHMDRILQRLTGENIDLAVTLSPELGQIKADASQMEQVILNLVLNARDAMPQGGKLTLGTQNMTLDQDYVDQHPEVRPGQYVMMAVTDTGKGIDDKTMSRIFEPFFTTKDRGKGTGLGLSTVYGIVKQCGGYVSVYSELGHGTCCKVYLPRVTETEHPQPLQPPSTNTLKGSGSETILVVEDEEKLRKLVCRVLRDKGYTILEAASGNEALRISNSHEGPIALLLTDVIMPGLNGRETADTLTAKRPETKVIYMSGYTEDVIFHHGVLEEGINLLQKPFTSDALTQRVRKALDGIPK